MILTTVFRWDYKPTNITGGGHPVYKYPIGDMKISKKLYPYNSIYKYPTKYSTGEYI
jgi:hypothetical protein